SKPAAPSTSAAANLRRGSTPVDRARGDRQPVERPTPARSEGKKAVKAAPAPVKTGPGSLVVDSRPAGANVFVDGRLIGTTPLVMETMSVGDHAIRLDREGYQRWATSVRIVSGERSRVAASLER